MLPFVDTLRDELLLCAEHPFFAETPYSCYIKYYILQALLQLREISPFHTVVKMKMTIWNMTQTSIDINVASFLSILIICSFISLIL